MTLPKLDKRGWSASGSSIWHLGTDGVPARIIDGQYEWDASRSFWSPEYTRPNPGEWVEIRLGGARTLQGVVIHQNDPNTRMSSLVTPVKDSRLLRRAELRFSDGSTESVTFPPTRGAQVLFSSPKTTESVRLTIVDFHDDYAMAGLWLLELDLLGAPQAPPPVVVPDPDADLVAYYPFNANADDESGNHNHGTPLGPTVTRDVNQAANSAYLFDGRDDHVKVPSSETLQGMGELTLSAWIRCNDTSPRYQEVMVKGTNDYLLRLDNAGGGAYLVGCINNDFVAVTDPGVVTPNRWHHIAFSWWGSDPNVAAFHVDGVAVYTKITMARHGLQSAVRASDNPLYIGTWGSSEFFHGEIDNVRIHARALSGAEIETLHRVESGQPAPPPPPRPTYSHSAVDFGEGTLEAGSLSRFITFDNQGDGPLIIDGLALFGPDAAEFRFIQDQCIDNRLPAHQSCQLEVVFAPTSEGNKRASLGFTTNDPARPTVEIELSGGGGAGVDLHRGLIGYYPFTYGGADESGNGANGSVQGASPTRDRFDRADRALAFSGADGDDRVVIPASAHPTGEVSVTYSAWIRQRDRQPGMESHRQSIVDVGEGGGAENRRSGLAVSEEGRLHYVGGGNDCAFEHAALPLKRWTHVAVTKSGTSLRAYVDGRFVDAATTRPGQDLRNGTIRIGGANDGVLGRQELFSGAIDEVRIHRRALSEEEIRRLFAAPEAPTARARVALDGAQRLVLDGSRSHAADDGGRIVAWEWLLSDYVDGEPSARLLGERVGLDGIAPGRYRAALTVTDHNGGRDVAHLELALPRCAPPNRAPEVVEEFADLRLQFGTAAVKAIDLSRHFSDPDDDAMRFAVSASESGVVATAIERGVLRISAVNHGTTRLTVTAEDGEGATRSESFEVTVSDADELRRLIILALVSARLHKGSRVLSGDVVVNRRGSERRYRPRAELTLHHSATLPAGSVAKANRIRLHRHARVDGALHCNAIHDPGERGGESFIGLALPVFATLPPIRPASPGAEDLRLSRKTRQTLGEGAYGEVRVGPGATLTLAGGRYHLRSLTLDKGGRLLVEGATEIRIAKRLLAHASATLAPADGVVLRPLDLAIHVAGEDQVHYSASGRKSHLRAVRIGPGSRVRAGLYAFNGTLWVSSRVRVSGTLQAREVVVGSECRIGVED